MQQLLVLTANLQRKARGWTTVSLMGFFRQVSCSHLLEPFRSHLSSSSRSFPFAYIYCADKMMVSNVLPSFSFFTASAFLLFSSFFSPALDTYLCFTSSVRLNYYIPSFSCVQENVKMQSYLHHIFLSLFISLPTREWLTTLII